MSKDKTHKKKLYWYVKTIIDPKSNRNKLLKYKKWLHTENTTVSEVKNKKSYLVRKRFNFGFTPGISIPKNPWSQITYSSDYLKIWKSNLDDKKLLQIVCCLSSFNAPTKKNYT